jgi:ketosteroid isomerase-like protein
MGTRLSHRLLAAVALVSAAPRLAAAQGPADSATVLAALRHYAVLVQRMASDSIAAQFTADGELLDANRPPIVGPAAIGAFLSSFSAFHVLDDSMIATTTEVRGDTSVQTGRFWQRVQVPAGDTVVAQGGFVITWLWDPRAGWRIRRMGTAP